MIEVTISDQIQALVGASILVIHTQQPKHLFIIRYP